MTNAGFYLIDTKRIRELAAGPDITRIRKRRLDFGKDLLPWLVGHDHPVHVFPVRAIGDLGNVRDYLATMTEALRGQLSASDSLLGPSLDDQRSVWIARDSRAVRDSITCT